MKHLLNFYDIQQLHSLRQFFQRWICSWFLSSHDSRRSVNAWPSIARLPGCWRAGCRAPDEALRRRAACRAVPGDPGSASSSFYRCRLLLFLLHSAGKLFSQKLPWDDLCASLLMQKHSSLILSLMTVLQESDNPSCSVFHSDFFFFFFCLHGGAWNKKAFTTAHLCLSPMSLILESCQHQSCRLSRRPQQHRLYIQIVFTPGLKVWVFDKGNLLTTAQNTNSDFLPQHLRWRAKANWIKHAILQSLTSRFWRLHENSTKVIPAKTLQYTTGFSPLQRTSSEIAFYTGSVAKSRFS